MDYWKKYWSSDKRWLKYYILAVFLLDTVHQALYIKGIHKIFVSGFGDRDLVQHNSRFDITNSFEIILNLRRLLLSTGLLTSVICCFAQVFYILRIWKRMSLIFTVTS